MKFPNRLRGKAFFYQQAGDHFHQLWKASAASWWNVSAFACGVQEVHHGAPLPGFDGKFR